MCIVRVVHNRENPYVVLNKKALWNEKLSLKAIGLWARCMSRPDDWRFNVTELANSGKEGKRAIYTAIDELIREGYALRLDHTEKSEDGKFSGGGVEYVFFEFPPTSEEKQDYIDKFKKSFRQSGFGDSRNGDSRNAPLLSTKEELKKEKKINKEGPTSSSPSADADLLYNFFLEKLRERNPDFKEPKKNKWLEQFDRMLRIDNRSVEEIKKLIEWASEHKWWKSACLSPHKLREAYDEMSMQMKSQEEKDLVKKNRGWAITCKEKVPEHMKSMSFDDKFVIHRQKAKEIPFNLPHEQFKNLVIELFGGRHVPSSTS